MKIQWHEEKGLGMMRSKNHVYDYFEEEGYFFPREILTLDTSINMF